MINLSDEDKKIIHDYFFGDSLIYCGVKRFDLSTGSYYAKYCCGDNALKELFGKKIFDFVGIKSPEYKYYDELNSVIICEDLHSIGNFTYMSKIPRIIEETRNKTFSFGMLIDNLRELCLNKEEIYIQAVVMHFIDILFSNIDRHLNNYGIFIEDNIGTLAVFDNGLFLSYFDNATKPPSCPTYNKRNSKIIECEHFFQSLPNEYIVNLYEIYLRFNVLFVKKLMCDIEKNTGKSFYSKKGTLLKFYKNYLLIGCIFNKYLNNNVKKSVKSEVKLSMMKKD